MAFNSNEFLFINLLWYDENIFNKENEIYRRKLSQIIRGVFIPCESLTLLHGILGDLDRRNTQQFIVISSGSASENVIREKQGKQRVVVSVIIFCWKLEKWIHLKGNENIVEVVNRFDNLLKCLKELAKGYKFENIVDECKFIPLDYYSETLGSIHKSVASKVKANFTNFDEYKRELLVFSMVFNKEFQTTCGTSERNNYWKVNTITRRP